MKFLLITGSGAVGKMTVGQELCKITPFRLFHNHMTIEPVIDIFGSFNSHVSARLREVVFEEFAKSDNYGLVFTFMWAFDEPADWAYVEHITGIFEAAGAEIFCVELIAPQQVRLQRNISENRLAHKASKRDIETSRERMLNEDARYRLVSLPGEIKISNYLRLENADISAAEAAEIIKEHFSF